VSDGIINNNNGLEEEASGIQEATFLDTSGTPDTILLDWFSALTRTQFTQFISSSIKTILQKLKTFFYERQPGVQDATFLDTSGTPDTILLDWVSVQINVLPIYNGETAGGTGEKVFAGDMGVYIG